MWHCFMFDFDASLVVLIFFCRSSDDGIRLVGGQVEEIQSGEGASQLLS